MSCRTIEDFSFLADSAQYPSHGNMIQGVEYARKKRRRNSSMKSKLMLTDSKKQPVQLRKERSVRRCPLVATAEVTEARSGARLLVRISEVGLGGCYVDALNPFPPGTMVGLRILRDQGVFESKARVVYCDPGFGMGLAFTEVMPKQRSVLEDWLAETISQLSRNR